MDPPYEPDPDMNDFEEDAEVPGAKSFAASSGRDLTSKFRGARTLEKILEMLVLTLFPHGSHRDLYYLSPQECEYFNEINGAMSAILRHALSLPTH